MASDLGESQARRVLDLLSIQENGDVAYYVGGLLSDTPPHLVDISKISFSSRKVEKDSLKDKFMNWLNPRYHIIMNNAETDEVDIIETKSFYIREGNHFKNIRFLTRSEDDGSIEEDDNSDLSVGCHELQYKGGALTEVITCRFPYIQLINY